MAVRIRMKRLGRTHRPFYRICAMDARAPRDGRVIEELGYYDPMVKETDARAILNGERIDYWLGVGAQPSQKVAVLIKKYGTKGTHLDAQTAALERCKLKPTAPAAVAIALPKKDAEAPAEEAAPSAEEATPAPEAEAQADQGAAEASSEESTNE